MSRVELVGGGVPRIDGQLFGSLQHVTRSVHHRLPSNHNRLLGLASLTLKKKKKDWLVKLMLNKQAGESEKDRRVGELDIKESIC